MKQISNFLIKIKHSLLANHKALCVCWSVNIYKISSILKLYNIIEDVMIINVCNKKLIILLFKVFNSSKKVFLYPISVYNNKCKMSYYVKYKDIDKVLLGKVGLNNKAPLAVLTTSKGIMSAFEAKNLKIGGVVLFIIL